MLTHKIKTWEYIPNLSPRTLHLQSLDCNRYTEEASEIQVKDGYILLFPFRTFVFLFWDILVFFWGAQGLTGLTAAFLDTNGPRSSKSDITKRRKAQKKKNPKKTTQSSSFISVRVLASLRCKNVRSSSEWQAAVFYVRISRRRIVVLRYWDSSKQAAIVIRTRESVL